MSLNEDGKFVVEVGRQHPLKLLPKNILRLPTFKSPH